MRCLWSHFDSGDTDRPLVLGLQLSVTAFYHVLAAKQLAEIAEALGMHADSEKWAKQHAAGQAAYHARFYDASVGGYSPCVSTLKTSCHNTSARGSQTSNSMALALG